MIKWYENYEKKGFSSVFCTPYEQYREHNGKHFNVLRRCTEDDWDLVCLPAWDIELEDGTKISAYPEEIISIEMEHLK